MKCNGMTPSGKCKRPAMKGKAFCYHHEKQRSSAMSRHPSAQQIFNTPCIICKVDRPGVELYTTDEGHKVHPACKSKYDYAIKAPDGWYEDSDGVVRWESNNSVIPKDFAATCVTIGLLSEDQLDLITEVGDQETQQFLANYRANPPQRSAEELAEIKAAFGDEPVVDIITGKHIQ